MNYKKIVIDMIQIIEEDDIVFLSQLYTIIIRHIKKRRKGR